MRIDVTPLGGQGRSVASIAATIVDYLENAVGDPGAELLSPTSTGGVDGAAGYYADSREGPGSWLGAGADWHRLGGEVDREAFTRVLEGRHPATGERLITARGSSQRAHLAAGTAARFDAGGRPLYSPADAAVLLKVSQGEVAAMIAAGDENGVDPADPAALAVVEVDGVRYVPDDEITRVLELAATPPTGEAVLADGDPDDMLTTTEAARLLGVTGRYVRRLCARTISDPAGDDDRRARLASTRGDDGNYRIRRADLAELARHRKPPIARVAYDVTLTAEKSVGVVMLLADSTRQGRFVAAFDAANTVAMTYLDRHAALARRGDDVVATEGLTVASYMHATSRAGDPHPHRHNVVANTVVDDHGAVRALDARGLYIHGPAAAALATAALRWELRDLGLGWWRRDNGIWEIAGADEAVLAEFSSRGVEIDEIRAALTAELGRPVTREENRRIWESTRTAKQRLDPKVLVAGWRQRAHDLGFDHAACFDRPDQALTFEVLPDELVTRLVDDLVDPEAGVCAHTDRFTRTAVVKAIVDWSTTIDRKGRDVRKVLVPPVEVERLTDVFLSCEHVVPLAAGLAEGVIQRRDGQTVDSGQAQPTYSTVEMLDTQRRAIEAWSRGANASRGVARPRAVERAIVDSEVELSGEQVELVRDWCRCGHLAHGAIGYAGAGKTTAMAAAARAWEASGYKVVGAAVKGEAARQLAHDAGIPAETLALWLTKARTGDSGLDARTVLIVDEGSTLGDRELAELLELCNSTGATLRIIGDPVQHSAVSAGGVWTFLMANPDLARTTPPTLTTVHRLRDDGERARAERARTAPIERIIAEMAAAGQLVLTDSDVDTYTGLLARWYHARQTGEAHPMVHGRNTTRRMLNQIAQGVLIADGDVDPTRAVTLRDGRQLCVGDRVLARHGDRRIHPDGRPDDWLRNGTTGTIVAVRHGRKPVDDRLVIETDAGEMTVPRRTFDRQRGGLDHAYAVTSYAVQGSTRDASTSAVTATTSRSELYVDITRGRHSNQVFATRTVEAGSDESDQHLPTIDVELIDELARRVRRPDRATPAAVDDPNALAVAALRRNRTLAKLLADQRAGKPGPYDEAVARTEAVIRATTSDTAALHAVLPECPDAPHVAVRHQALAGDIAVYRATHNRPGRHPRHPIEHILGPEPSAPVARADWTALADRLVRVAVDTAIARAERHDPLLRTAHLRNESWVRTYLDGPARSGQLARATPEVVAERLAAVHAWRTDHDIDGDDVLGSRPADPVAARRYDQLAADLRPPVSVERGVEIGVA